MKTNLITLVLVLLLMNSCDYHLRDIAQEQGAEGVEEICLFHGDTQAWVRTGNPDIQRLCKGRYFHYHDGEATRTRFITESGAGYGTIVSGHIAESVYDSVFLLADRKPLDSIFGLLQTLPCPFDSNSTYRGRPYDSCTNIKDRERQLRESPIHDFWIIDQKTSDVYGPMSFDDYLAKKKELGVPSTLRLKCEQ